MTIESTSNKLSELFELHKTGAITKEEYEKLKKQVLSEEGVISTASERRQEQPVPKTADKPIQEKKGSKVWIFSLIAIVLVAVIVFVLIKTNLFSGKSEATDIPVETVEDIDGNIYHTITIGSQVWMVENLKTTRYNDGTPIPLATDNSVWRKLTTPAYCWYNNDEITNKNTFGALYNWYAVNTKKLCPDGWHVPSDSEWTILIEYLSKNGYGFSGSGDDIGKSLASTAGWNVSSDLGSVGNDPSSNNKSGFTAFASGIRFSNGEFRHSGQNSKWWSSTGTSSTAAQIRFIAWEDGIVTSFSNRKENGFSVRCVKDIAGQDSNITSSTEKFDEQDKNIDSNNPEANRLSSQTEPEKNSRINKFVSTRWDEDAASRIVMNDLSDNTSEWSDTYERYVEDMSHKVAGYYDIVHGQMNFKLALVFSEFWECPPYCGGPIISIYEFKQMQDAWYLTRKAIGFHGFYSPEDIKVINFIPLSSTKYGVQLKGSHFNGRTAAGTHTNVDVYIFSGNEIKNIFNAYNGSYDLNCTALGFNNKTYLEIEKFTDSNSSKKYYEFDGNGFEEYNGSFTDLSLTSMDRMGLFEHAAAKEKGICPTCNGTGVQICTLCGGTGVNNMGMECGCIRAYNMEKTAGNTPSHKPLRWTCISCGGSGNYDD